MASKRDVKAVTVLEIAAFSGLEGNSSENGTSFGLNGTGIFSSLTPSTKSSINPLRLVTGSRSGMTWRAENSSMADVKLSARPAAVALSTSVLTRSNRCSCTRAKAVEISSSEGLSVFLSNRDSSFAIEAAVSMAELAPCPVSGLNWEFSRSALIDMEAP